MIDPCQSFESQGGRIAFLVRKDEEGWQKYGRKRMAPKYVKKERRPFHRKMMKK